MSVRIRMKQFGRKHRPYFRICAMDIRRPRDGRVLEQLGTYDPLVPETDARAVLKGERIAYWISVGAKPSDKVQVLIKKYGVAGRTWPRRRKPWTGWPKAANVPSRLRRCRGRRSRRATKRKKAGQDAPRAARNRRPRSRPPPCEAPAESPAPAETPAPEAPAAEGQG